jgi:hypothetical protein
MKNKKNNLDPKLRGFVGFIPKALKLEAKPELAVFPLNILIGRYTVRDGKHVLGTALYEPDLSSLAIDEYENLILNYNNRYDRRYFLKIIIEKGYNSRRCEKYREAENIGTAYGKLDWENKDESWNNFFQQVAFLGLDNGERCHFSDVKA